MSDKQLNELRRLLLQGTAVAAVSGPLGFFLSRLNEHEVEKTAAPEIPRLDENKLALHESLKYRPFSVLGQRMDDGTKVPELHDGMGAFAGADGHTLLVRNHEVYVAERSPLPDLAYDPGCRGGSTTIELDRDLNVVRHHLSLTGSRKNCGGGATPWGTWLSCEEMFDPAEKPHGYVFEVDPRATTLKKGQPLKALGRFVHEAAAVDPASGVVYMTEDQNDSCLYRLVPAKKGRLADGGVLQALTIDSDPRYHTTKYRPPSGEPIPCHWVDVRDPDPKQDDVRYQAQELGAAIFIRGEGMWMEGRTAYFSCTTGGRRIRGQIFKYTPTGDDRGHLELVYEGRDRSLVQPDNMTMSPWGDLIVCEDHDGKINRLVGLTPELERYTIATSGYGSFAGVCFSVEGRALFANLQYAGYSLAITGDWASVRG